MFKTVDFSNLKRDRSGVMNMFGEGLEQDGAIIATGLHISAAPCSKLLQVSNTFFRNQEDKKRYIFPAELNEQGYTPEGGEQAFDEAGTRTPEQRKRFWRQQRLMPPTTGWSDDAKQLSNHSDIVFRECDVARATPALLLGEYLGVGSRYLQMTTFGNSVLNIVDYDGCPGLVATAHTDLSIFTVLLDDTDDGVEFEDEKGKHRESVGGWLAIRPRPDAAIIMAGRSLQIDTNGRIKAKKHRVFLRQPQPNGRSSMAYFCHGKKDDIIGHGDQATTVWKFVSSYLTRQFQPKL